VLTGAKSRGILRHVETVIVDEIHAVARDRRGSHWRCRWKRLDALAVDSGQWAVGSQEGLISLPTATAHCPLFEAGARRAVGDAEADR